MLYRHTIFFIWTYKCHIDIQFNLIILIDIYSYTINVLTCHIIIVFYIDILYFYMNIPILYWHSIQLNDTNRYLIMIYFHLVISVLTNYAFVNMIILKFPIYKLYINISSSYSIPTFHKSVSKYHYYIDIP